MGKRIIRKSPILNSQANEVLKLVKDQGLDPLEFSWEHTESSNTADLYVSKILHISTGSFFKFDFKEGKHFCVFSPGKEKQKESIFSGSWELQISYINKWLSYLKREIASPNLWETISQQILLKSDIDKIHSNDLFTNEEINKIQSSIGEIKEYVLATYNLTDSNKVFLENKLNYLIDSSNRLGRKDWIIILIGIITNIVMSLSFSPDTAKDFFIVVSKAFDWLGTYTVLLQ